MPKIQPNNVVIVDEAKEDGGDRDPYEMLGGCEFDAKIRRL